MDSLIVKPSISVVMPVYNAAKYLHESIDSILQQTFEDFEFFIIDDASTDESVQIIESYSDKRIRFIQKPINTGYTDSLNMAIALAKGKYIARMDADDISLPTRFEMQFNYMEKHLDVLVLGTPYKVIDTDTIVQAPLSNDEAKVVAIMDVPVAHPSVLIRKEVFEKYELFYNRNAEPAEDYDLWSKVLNFGKIENLPDILLHYRNHEGQISRQKQDLVRRNVYDIRVANISKLIEVKNNKQEALFAIDVLTKAHISLDNEVISKIRMIIVKMYQTNETKKEYNQFFLFRYLRSVWLNYILQYDPSFKDVLLLGTLNRSRITRLDFKQSIKFFLKILASKQIRQKIRAIIGNAKI